MSLKAVLSKEEIPDGLQEHYQEKDGKYYLSVEGMAPECQLAEARQKAAEFRDNNIKYLKEREDMVSRLKNYEGIDPEEYRSLKEQTKKLETKGVKNPDDIESLINRKLEDVTKNLGSRIQAIEQEKAELHRQIEFKELEKTLSDAARKAKVRDVAMEDAIRRGMQVYKLVNGKVVPTSGDSILYSQQDLDKTMPAEEFYQILSKSAPHLFEPSSGGGASNTMGGTSQNAMTLTNPSKEEFGKNLEAIAKGKVRVVSGRF